MGEVLFMQVCLLALYYSIIVKINQYRPIGLGSQNLVEALSLDWPVRK